MDSYTRSILLRIITGVVKRLSVSAVPLVEYLLKCCVTKWILMISDAGLLQNFWVLYIIRYSKEHHVSAVGHVSFVRLKDGALILLGWCSG
jgi:hypothetical protein